MPEKPSAAGTRCSCDVCLLHPHLKEALSRMQPPELRLYSHAELMELLQRDISIADDADRFRVGSDESWWHLCAADPTFPFYCIPTKEFIYSLASYVACRVRCIWSSQRRRTDSCPSKESEAACDHPGDVCCSKRVSPQPVRMLECGAGTGLLAAHLLPLLRRLLQQNEQTSSSAVSHAQHAQEQRKALDKQVEQQRACKNSDVFGASGRKRPLITNHAAFTKSKKSAATDTQVSAVENDEPIFKYIASEPRQTLQWCPREVAATGDGCRSVMRQLCPQLVICCWMPFNVDWTQAARASCCACCKEAGGDASNGLQLLGCACQVQEYILIGHAEGGLVGRPFETWGLSCPQENVLPLGVDYEDLNGAPTFPSSSTEDLNGAPSFPSSSTAQPHTQATVSAPTEAGNKFQESFEKHGEDGVDEGGAAAHWRPQNSFTSIPPVRGEEDVTSSIDATEVSEVASDEQETFGQFGGMELLPLNSRPYHRDGFTRLPPLLGYEGQRASHEAPEEEKCLQVLQGTQQLSRFDSLRSLLNGCRSVSRVVIFRRMVNEDTLNAT
ncbi:hypothetical protein Emag_001836 [Eimeria magna]